MCSRPAPPPGSGSSGSPAGAGVWLLWPWGPGLGLSLRGEERGGRRPKQLRLAGSGRPELGARQGRSGERGSVAGGPVSCAAARGARPRAERRKPCGGGKPLLPRGKPQPREGAFGGRLWSRAWGASCRQGVPGAAGWGSRSARTPFPATPRFSKSRLPQSIRILGASKAGSLGAEERAVRSHPCPKSGRGAAALGAQSAPAASHGRQRPAACIAPRLGPGIAAVLGALERASLWLQSPLEPLGGRGGAGTTAPLGPLLQDL